MPHNAFQKPAEFQTHMKMAFALAIIIALMVVLSPMAHAATDTLFQTGINKMMTILTGTGGILITLVTLLTAIVLGATGNIKSALAVLGVALLASIGPNIATSFFTATL